MQDHPAVAQTLAYVKERQSGESSGHDWWHTWRVYQTALALAEEEGGDPLIVALGALLHDIADHKFHDGDTEIGPHLARAWLERLHLDEHIIEAVVDIVRTISFKGAGVATPMKTLEGAIVQDADRLDAIGAIGIARAFAYGGHAGRAMYDPEERHETHDSFESYKNAKSGTIAHFYEKLLLLKDRMNTDAGRALAETRHAFMESYLRQFFAEWSCSPDGKTISNDVIKGNLRIKNGPS